VKTRIQYFSFVAILAVAFGMVSLSSTLHAQTTTPSTPTDQQPMPQQASPDNTPTGQTQQPPAQAPEAPPATQQPPTAKAPDQAQSSDSDSTPAAAGVQVFTGTVVKSGDKYRLKDDSGQTYNIDHQDEVAKFEGKHIRVHGMLDEKGAIQVK
jgi:hypothetical protein